MKILAFLLALFLTSCYLTKQSYYHLKIVWNTIPLESAINEETDLEKKELLALVEDILKFSEEYLLLKTKRNYQKYYQTDKKSISFAVSASPLLEMKAYQWWFPILGKVDYKGFFVLEDAQKEAQKISQKDYEIWISPVSAYSTLGWFDDPITTPMLLYGKYYLINTLIHETTHSTLYFKNQTALSEQLASFVAKIGSEQFLKGQGKEGEKLLLEQRQRQKKYSQFTRLMKQTYSKAEMIYQNTTSDEEKLVLKKQLFENTKKEILEIYPKASKNFLKLNNARLLQFKRYAEDNPTFENIWLSSGKDWQMFWKKVRQDFKIKD